MKALFLRDTGVAELKKNILVNLPRYREKGFEFLETDTNWHFNTDIELNEKEISSLRIERGEKGKLDAPNCATMLKILPALSPYEASDERLWTFLTHTLLLEYGRARWPIPEDDDEATKHIRKHFFASVQRQLERDNLASRLWWVGMLCARVPAIDLQTALEVFLYRADVRANIVERPTTAQSLTVFSAILRKLLASYQTDKRLFDRKLFRPLMMALNGLGGFKLLDVFDPASIERLLDDLIGQVSKPA